MKEYMVLLANLSDKEKSIKIRIARDIIGDNNVVYVSKDFNDYNIPYIILRCKKKKFKEVLFQLGLKKMEFTRNRRLFSFFFQYCTTHL